MEIIEVPCLQYMLRVCLISFMSARHVSDLAICQLVFFTSLHVTEQSFVLTGNSRHHVRVIRCSRLTCTIKPCWFKWQLFNPHAYTHTHTLMHTHTCTHTCIHCPSVAMLSVTPLFWRAPPFIRPALWGEASVTVRDGHLGCSLTRVLLSKCVTEVRGGEGRSHS